MAKTDTQWWLAELDKYGNPKLVDGPHGDKAGVNKAAYLMAGLGLQRGRTFAVARVTLSAVKPSAKGVNMDAMQTMGALVRGGLG